MIKQSILFLIPFIACLTTKAGRQDKVEIVICADLSGSTNGLLTDLKDNFYRLVENASLKNHNAEVKIGVVAYARPSFGATSAYVKILSDITNNYDLVFNRLADLKPSIEKGDQFVGNALYVSALGLHWSEEPGVKKMIFLIGNGKVNTGRFNFEKACELARKKNISIHTLYCILKNPVPSDIPQWVKIADLSTGQAATVKISQSDRKYYPLNFGKEVEELNKKFLSTFIYYGTAGKLSYNNMCRADSLHRSISVSAYCARTKFVTADSYNTLTYTWDLVSLSKINLPDFSKLERKQLPDSMQNYDAEKIKSIVLEKKDQRNYLSVQLRNSIGTLKSSYAYSCQADSIFSEMLK